MARRKTKGTGTKLLVVGILAVGGWYLYASGKGQELVDAFNAWAGSGSGNGGKQGDEPGYVDINADAGAQTLVGEIAAVLAGLAADRHWQNTAQDAAKDAVPQLPSGGGSAVDTVAAAGGASGLLVDWLGPEVGTKVGKTVAPIAGAWMGYQLYSGITGPSGPEILDHLKETEGVDPEPVYAASKQMRQAYKDAGFFGKIDAMGSVMSDYAAQYPDDAAALRAFYAMTPAQQKAAVYG